MLFSFKNWLQSEESHDICYFWEMVDLKSADTSHINFTKITNEFDENAAQSDCEDEVEHYFDESEFTQDIYDDYTDDPNFSTINAEEWEEGNPPPERSDFENDEEFESAMNQWQDDKEAANDEFESAVANWEEEQKELREKLDEKISDAKHQEVLNCIENKRENHDSDSEEEEYHYNFKVENKDYRLTIEKEKIIWMRNHLDNIYIIYFTGPKGFKTTQESGTLANKIYSELILGLKKFIEENDVDGLEFSAYEPQMVLMYNRFYNTFMKEKFIRVSSTLYLKKDLVRKIMKDQSFKVPEIADEIISAGRESRSINEAIKYMKFAKRAADRLAPSLVNHFVPLYRWPGTLHKLGFVLKYNNNGSFLLFSPETGAISDVDYSLFALPWTKLTAKDIQGDFINYVQNLNYDDHDYFPVMKSPIMKSKLSVDDMSIMKNFKEMIKIGLNSFYELNYNYPSHNTLFNIYPTAKHELDKYAHDLGVQLQPQQQPQPQTQVQPQINKSETLPNNPIKN